MRVESKWYAYRPRQKYFPNARACRGFCKEAIEYKGWDIPEGTKKIRIVATSEYTPGASRSSCYRSFATFAQDAFYCGLYRWIYWWPEIEVEE